MKIAIIGSGIYGCHLALHLVKHHQIDIYEREPDIFAGASSFNSFRIHKGYHYPRSGKTREMCKRDEAKFVKLYRHLIGHPDKYPKIFCIADDKRSLIDDITMKLILRGSGLPYQDLSHKQLVDAGFSHVESGLMVNEGIFFGG